MTATYDPFRRTHRMFCFLDRNLEWEQNLNMLHEPSFLRGLRGEQEAVFEIGDCRASVLSTDTNRNWIYFT